MEAGRNAVRRRQPLGQRAQDGGSPRGSLPPARRSLLAAERSRPAIALYQTTTDPDLKRLLLIMGSRWDLLDENRPFIGNEPMPPGHELYPRDLTRAQIEQYVQQHPAEKAAIYDEHSVVKRQGAAPDRRPLPRGVQAVARTHGQGAARRRRTERRPRLRQLPAPARRRPAHRRLLRERPGLARSEGSEVRRHLRALRNLPRRSARREDLLRRLRPDPQRSGERANSPSIRSTSRIFRTRCRSPPPTVPPSAAT